MLVAASLRYVAGQKWGLATVYEHEPRNIGLKSEPSRLDTKPCFTDWLLQNVRRILDTTPAAKLTLQLLHW